MVSQSLPPRANSSSRGLTLKKQKQKKPDFYNIIGQENKR